MAEIKADVSSYPKPAAEKSLLDQVQQYGAIQQQKINIDRSKLEQAIIGQDQLLKVLSSIPPTATNEEITSYTLPLVKSKIINAKQYADFMTNLGNDPESRKKFLELTQNQAASRAEAMRYIYGEQFVNQNAQGSQYGLRDPRAGTVRPTTGVFGAQPSIDQQYIEPGTNKIKRVGQQSPSIPEGTEQLPGGFQGEYRPNDLRFSVQPPAVTGPRINGPVPSTSKIIGDAEAEAKNLYEKPTFQAQVQQPSSFNDRFSTVQREPGAAEAEVATGRQSGEALAAARQRATNFAQDMFPVTQAIEASKNLGTKGTGPGTETINQVKSFILSNFPNIRQSDPGFDNIKDFDKLNKYLIQIAQGSGFGTDTNDKLAAAFAGNPSVKISNAATQDILGSIAALRTLDLARTKAWEKSGLQDNQYSKWAANWHNNIDPRAFAIPYMSPEAIVKLNKTLKGKEREKFNNSVEIARQSGI